MSKEEILRQVHALDATLQMRKLETRADFEAIDAPGPLLVMLEDRRIGGCNHWHDDGVLVDVYNGDEEPITIQVPFKNFFHLGGCALFAGLNHAIDTRTGLKLFERPPLAGRRAEPEGPHVTVSVGGEAIPLNLVACRFHRDVEHNETYTFHGDDRPRCESARERVSVILTTPEHPPVPERVKRGTLDVVVTTRKSRTSGVGRVSEIAPHFDSGTVDVVIDLFDVTVTALAT